MEQEQQQPEKKIWIDPELTYMPMDDIKSFHISGHPESVFVRQYTNYYGAPTDRPPQGGS